jgi:DNA polymerase-4
MARRILHLDMDAFFASVEQHDRPELKGRPVIVGGSSDRGVVSACSYEARKFGVHSAMPMFRARKLCPQAVVLSVRGSRYSEVSRQVMGVLARYSPLLEKASVDEAYLDVSGCATLHGPPRDMALRIKAEIRDLTGLACSVGIAPVKFLAKIASDWDKPDGLFILEEADVPAFLQELPVTEIPGVGKRAAESLRSMGVSTCGDVLRYPEGFWRRRGKFGQFLYDRARGIDHRGVVTHYEAKSESAENTFRENTRDKEELRRWLWLQAERVGASLRREGTPGRTVTLKLKYADHRSITRSRTLPEPTAATKTISDTASRLLEEVELEQAVRLVGVGVSNFHHGPVQLSLLEDLEGPRAGDDGRKDRLDKALDAVRERFGRDAVVSGRVFGFRKK